MTSEELCNEKPKAKFSINYDMSFGIDVTQKEIDDQRQGMIELNKPDYIWNLKIDKNSTDEEIAIFIGVRDHHIAEATNLENIEAYSY